MTRRPAALLFIGLSALLAGMITARTANADLLVDPTGGTSLIFSDPDNSVRTGRPLGFTGQFFGVNETTVDVSTNGNLNFSGNSSFADGIFPRSTARIAPLWDDLLLNDASTVPNAPPSAIVEKVSPGVYYSVTWENVYRTTSLNPNKTDTFQAVWFGAATTIGGFTFQPNDIAFAYQMVNADFDGGAATVGVNKGSANAAAILPGSANGVITATTKNLLPLAVGQFVLFHPNGAGGYVASIQSAAAMGASVTGSVSLEGVTDLSLTSSAAPLGLFHIEFRQGATVVKQAEVPLIITNGSGKGAYTVTGVPAGTYSVAIKGVKNLRVLIPNVVISGASGTVPTIELPAGDANNDNSVDSTDFGLLIGEFNTAAIAGNGYDPAEDFNFDGSVDSTDFGLLIGEFNNVGAN